MDRIKKKRRQIRPPKKWGKEEVLQILKYIQRERNLEKPTAQIYYKKCLEETKINATWDLMRWKVKHLRRRFEEALIWKNKVKAGLIDVNIENMEKKLNQLCPHYNILLDIFGEKYKNSEFYDTGSDILLKNSLPMVKINVGQKYRPKVKLKKMVTANNENSYREPNAIEVNDPPSTSDCLPSIDFGQIEKVEMFTTNNENSYNREPNETEVNDPPSTSDCSNNNKDRPEVKLNKTIPKTAIEQLGIINKERNEILKLKLEAEKNYNERKMRLEELKFEEEKNRRKDEFELRKQELELKRMELERDERLKLYEIKMKYSTKDCSPDSLYYVLNNN